MVAGQVRPLPAAVAQLYQSLFMQTRRLVVRGRQSRAVAGALGGVLTCLVPLLLPCAGHAGELPGSLALVIAGIFTPPNTQTAADVVAAIKSIALTTQTPTLSPTPTATRTSSGTPTQTPTLRPCPDKT